MCNIMIKQPDIYLLQTLEEKLKSRSIMQRCIQTMIKKNKKNAVLRGNQGPQNSLTLERWQGPPHMNDSMKLRCPLKSVCSVYSVMKTKRDCLFIQIV